MSTLNFALHAKLRSSSQQPYQRGYIAIHRAGMRVGDTVAVDARHGIDGLEHDGCLSKDYLTRRVLIGEIREIATGGGSSVVHADVAIAVSKQVQ